ncbi:hypothetical protein LSH36_2470g00002 [Paralvinella palmiformis]|uniref:Uncharacterized protein n=1 Tax=Paralvinella palmiformis TaxID=53620 RepID=A0AAD9MLH5_9ANNE|nr:hypothetical protein LSH36_2470g00002 [Paralvinella palmiformis]
MDYVFLTFINLQNGFFAKLSFKSSQKMVHVVVADTSHDIKSLESKAKHTKQDFIQEQTLKINARTVQHILKVVAKLADGYHLGLQ